MKEASNITRAFHYRFKLKSVLQACLFAKRLDRDCVLTDKAGSIPVLLHGELADIRCFWQIAYFYLTGEYRFFGSLNGVHLGLNWHPVFQPSINTKPNQSPSRHLARITAKKHAKISRLLSKNTRPPHDALKILQRNTTIHP